MRKNRRILLLKWLPRWVTNFSQPLNEKIAFCLKTEKEVVNMRAYCESSMPLILKI